MTVLAEIHFIVVASHAEGLTWRLVEARGDYEASDKITEAFSEKLPEVKITSIIIHKPIE